MGTFYVPETGLGRNSRGDIIEVVVTDYTWEEPIITSNQSSSIHEGASSNFSVEALGHEDNQFVLVSVLTALADLLGINTPIGLAQFYADTNGDGMIGQADQLFSLVDLAMFLDAPTPFTVGDAFVISNGTSPGIPGWLFSTNEITFDPAHGFVVSAAFSGTAVVGAVSTAAAVLPEPDMMPLLATAFALLVISLRLTRSAPL